MYCTVNDMVELLPPTVTFGDQNIGTPIPSTTGPKRNQLTTTDAIYFIRFATQEIDSRLRNFYLTPLRRIKSIETEVLNDISIGTNVTIYVEDSGMFVKGYLVRIQDDTNSVTANVTDLPTLTSLKIDTLTQNFSNQSIISILQYPDPIPLITARLALSYAFDKLFNAEQAPDISTYGKSQRQLALNSIDGILTGTILLFGQEHTGRRFIRGSLYDGYNSPVQDIQFGREKQD